jgi:hypothetical protein
MMPLASAEPELLGEQYVSTLKGREMLQGDGGDLGGESMNPGGSC